MEKQTIQWTTCLQKVVDGVLQPYENGPEESGKYLCSCVIPLPYRSGKLLFEPIICQMEWDAERRIWYDVGNHGCNSRIVYAWANLEASQDFGFEYMLGGYLVPSDIGYKKTTKDIINILEFNDGGTYNL